MTRLRNDVLHLCSIGVAGLTLLVGGTIGGAAGRASPMEGGSVAAASAKITTAKLLIAPAPFQD